MENGSDREQHSRVVFSNKNIPRFDPETGEPVRPQSVLKRSGNFEAKAESQASSAFSVPRFDPETGEPLTRETSAYQTPRFDPETGESLTRETPAADAGNRPPKKNRRRIVPIAVLAAVLLAALAVGVYFILKNRDRNRSETDAVPASETPAPIESSASSAPLPIPQRQDPETPAPTPIPTPTPTPTPIPTRVPTPVPTPYPITDEPVVYTTPQPSPTQWIRPKQVQLKNDGSDVVTVLILMNGSDLESEYREATRDLSEMVAAKKNDRVNILVETVGTKKWDARYGISSNRTERYRVTETGLSLVDDSLGQLDTTVPSTLSDFIRWGAQNYPANRYILLLWDHGGGPVYGFGYDEYRSYGETLTLDEIRTALRDGGVYFDCIGMDCCLMSSLEVCCALYDYCDYALLSEDFEPGCGWAHAEWLTALAYDPAVPTEQLGRTVIDNSITVCENERGDRESMTLALIDESYIPTLFSAWLDFAYANEQTLLSADYSQMRESTGRAHPLITRSVSGWFTGSDGYALSDYCITDILSLAANIPSAQSEPLRAAFDTAIAYYRTTTNEKTLAGLSVTLPYGDAAFYGMLARVFRGAGLDADYIAWLEKFVDVDTGGVHYDFGDWNVWIDYIAGHDWGDWVSTLLDLGQLAHDWLNDNLDDETIDDLLGWLFGD